MGIMTMMAIRAAVAVADSPPMVSSSRRLKKLSRVDMMVMSPVRLTGDLGVVRQVSICLRLLFFSYLDTETVGGRESRFNDRRVSLSGRLED